MSWFCISDIRILFDFLLSCLVLVNPPKGGYVSFSLIALNVCFTCFCIYKKNTIVLDLLATGFERVDLICGKRKRKHFVITAFEKEFIILTTFLSYFPHFICCQKSIWVTIKIFSQHNSEIYINSTLCLCQKAFGLQQWYLTDQQKVQYTVYLILHQLFVVILGQCYINLSNWIRSIFSHVFVDCYSFVLWKVLYHAAVL